MSNIQSTSIGAPTPKPTTETEKKAWKASQDFEAILLRQIFQSMRKATSILSETDDKDEASTQMQDMAWDGMADQAAHGGGFGLAKMIYPKMLAGEGSSVPSEFRTPLPTPSSAASAYSESGNVYASSSNRSLNIDQMVTRAANDSGLDPALIRAVIQTESGGDVKARSPKGAIGPMQLMPRTAAELGVDPHDPVQNILGGSRYLAAMKKQFGSDRLALAAYNAGPGAVERHGDVPPYPETQAYVRKVLHARDTLSRKTP